ncbi:MAG: DUF5110 domain-containing protein [Bacteroidetes bacterium]|nr:DUF5110 domain-containing protein [Bacteroidota bacterium]
MRRTVLAFLFAALTTFAANASIKSYTKDAEGVNFVLDIGSMKLRVCQPDVIEVRYTMLPQMANRPSLVINNPWSTPTEFTVAEQGETIVITTKRLRIVVDKATNGVSYFDLSGGLVLAEDGAAGKTQNRLQFAGIATTTCETVFKSPADEALFGLGCHPLDSLAINYKGREQEMLIKYMTGAIPVMLSTKGYGLLWDNYSPSKFNGTLAGNTKYSYVSESGKFVDYFFFYGPSFDKIISLYRDATGRAPMFGKWAFGLFQSQDRYKSQDEVLTAGSKYRAAHIPVDVIVQDWYYWDPLPIGSHVMNPTAYPNPKAMVDELHSKNLHAMISIWPVFGKGTPNFDALRAMDGLTSITWDNVVTHTFDTYYDAHNPRARELYWQQARDSLVGRYGWDAWWIDQCEPDNGTLLDARRLATFYTGKGIDFYNTYSLMHTEGVYTKWRRDIPGKRAFFLARQAFAGQQRNGATLWSSDISCSWHDFKDQVPQGINACASGIPYWTSDIGGYHYHWQAPDWSQPDFRELFTRWFQFGAFCPVFRIHGKGERALFSSNWDEATRSTLLNFDNLRYRLLPYIYSLAGKTTQDQYTMLRSLAFLVNPVTDAGATSRPVYLPRGGWYDFWTGKMMAGGTSLTASAPVDILPLYVRAGSVIPMGPRMEYATEKPADTLELRVYPGANGQFTLYEDENETYNYEKGQFATIDFGWNDANKTLTIGDTKGTFPGQLKKRVFKIVIVSEGKGIGEAAAVAPDKVVTYLGKAMPVKMTPPVKAGPASSKKKP